MHGLAHLRPSVRERAQRIDELDRIDIAPARLALVSVGSRHPALIAFSDHVAIRQKLFRRRVVKLLRFDLFEKTFCVKIQEELLTQLLVQLDKLRLMGPAINIEVNAK